MRILLYDTMNYRRNWKFHPLCIPRTSLAIRFLSRRLSPSHSDLRGHGWPVLALTAVRERESKQQILAIAAGKALRYSVASSSLFLSPLPQPKSELSIYEQRIDLYSHMSAGPFSLPANCTGRISLLATPHSSR